MLPTPTVRRCFIAVPLPPAVRAALFATPALVAAECPGVRWQKKPENLHVTLQFLGNVADARAQTLADELQARLGDIAAFDVEVRGLGAFPSARRASVVWAGVDDGAGTLAQIAARLQSEADPREAGRAFRPHVTLGRVPQRAGLRAGVDVRSAVDRLAGTSFGRFAVDQVHLYESQLSRTGSTYRSLACAVLSSASGQALGNMRRGGL